MVSRLLANGVTLQVIDNESNSLLDDDKISTFLAAMLDVYPGEENSQTYKAFSAAMKAVLEFLVVAHKGYLLDQILSTN